MSHLSKEMKLPKPPVIMALFQLKFDKETVASLDSEQYDIHIRQTLPIKMHAYESNFQIPGSMAVGVTRIDANTKIVGSTYLSENQKIKLDVRQDAITFIDERVLYRGWENFQDSLLRYMEILNPVLQEKLVQRISIRFINRFNFDFEEFSNPTDYFKTFISTSETEKQPLPLNSFGFRLTHQIPADNDDIYAIVNHKLEKTPNKFLYFFDIDVLERVNLIYDQTVLLEKLERLRGIKNEIFFNNLTDKTLSLCN